jgi:branched-chain amino acid transport system substrate-binding protein
MLLALYIPANAAITCTDPLGCVTIGPGQPIHIAYALVTEGPDAFLGIDSRNGIQIAIDDSDGQILGHPIRFDGVNSGCSAEGGQSAGQALAADRSIVAVVGTSCSSAARAAIPLLWSAGMVAVSPSASAPDLTAPDRPVEYAAFLRTAASDKFQAISAANYAYEQLGVRRAATIHDGSLYGSVLQQAFSTEFVRLGGTITGQEATDPSSTNMTPMLVSLAAGSPDMLYFPVFVETSRHIISQARALPSLADVYLMGADGAMSSNLVTYPVTAIEGFLATSADVNQYTAEYYEHFLPAYQAQFGDPAAPFHANAYDAFMLIKGAIQRVAVLYPDGSVQIGRQSLRNALYATRSYPGLTGSLSCGASGDCATPHTAVFRFHPGQFPPERIWPMTSGTASPESGGMVTSYDGATVIQIPTGAVDQPVLINYRQAYGTPPRSSLARVGDVFAVTAVYSATGQPAQLVPGRTYTMTVSYTQAELGPAAEGTLALYHWNGSQWERAASSLVDPANNIVRGTPVDFGRWAVFGETKVAYLPVLMKSH